MTPAFLLAAVRLLDRTPEWDKELETVSFLAPFLVSMMMKYELLLKLQMLHVLETRRQSVQVVCFYAKLLLRCSCNTTCEGADLKLKLGDICAPHCQTHTLFACIWLYSYKQTLTLPLKPAHWFSLPFCCWINIRVFLACTNWGVTAGYTKLFISYVL